MNLEKLRNAGIDVEDGLRRFMNSEQMFEKYLRKFVDNDQFALLKQELEKKDTTAAEAFERAHALKGICANLSMAGIMEVLVPMVEILRSGSLEGVREKMPELEDRYQTIITAIKEI